MWGKAVVTRYNIYGCMVKMVYHKLKHAKKRTSLARVRLTRKLMVPITGRAS